MAQSPLVALVILTCNQKEHTLKCLDSLRCVEYANLRILLVDNGSVDGTYESVSAAYPDVTLLRNEKNEGASGGRNTGISHANSHLDYSYIMFMDNDTTVRPDFLSRLVEAIESCEDGRVEIASPMIYRMGTERVIDCAGGPVVNFYTGSTQTRGHGEEDTGQYDSELFPRCVPTTAVILKRTAMERAGDYDVSFDPYGYEDIDMVLRANPQRFPYLFVPHAVIYHLGSKTGFSGYTSAYASNKGKNLRRFFKRHATSFQWFCFNLLLPFLALRTIIRELRRGNVKAVWGLAKGFLGCGKQATGENR